MELTQQYLKSILKYDRDTGIFTWNISRSPRVKIGDIAGDVHTTTGYRRIGIKTSIYKRYSAHRLAWLYEYGSFPEDQIDHINHDRLDNRISNLRKVNKKENSRNVSIGSSNTSGIIGVGFHKDEKKWRAQIQVNKKFIHLGYFEYKNEAICARLHANRLYGFHKNHGKKITFTS